MLRMESKLGLWRPGDPHSETIVESVGSLFKLGLSVGLSSEILQALGLGLSLVISPVL